MAPTKVSVRFSLTGAKRAPLRSSSSGTTVKSTKAPSLLIDPVALHGANFFRPAVQLIQIAQQLVRVMGDAQKPLFQLALLDYSFFMPPAAAVDYLLIRQHGGALRAPVHFAFLAISQAALIHLRKNHWFQR